MGAAPQPLINLALRYVLFAEPATLDILRDEISRVGPFVDLGDPARQLVSGASIVRQLAVVYDWLYDALEATDRASIEGYLRVWADWYIAHEPTDVFSSAAYAQASAVALAGLALAGDTPDAGADGGVAAAARRYIAYADARWKTVLLPAMAYSADWWHEGVGNFNTVAGREALYWATAWTTATDEDAFAYARAHGDVFNNYVQFEAYALRPDFRYGAFGDATDMLLSPVEQTRPVMDMLSWGTGSTVAQGLALEVTRRVPVAQDYGTGESWHQVLFFDPTRPALPDRTSLPITRHFSPGAEDVVVMQSGWTPDDTWITLSCGDWFSPHQHDEVGSIQVFRGAPLVVNTGYFDGVDSPHWVDWYAQHSVHASTLSVFQPGEIFPNDRMLPNVNDGGQRPTLGTTGRTTLESYRANLTAGAQYDTGGITAFESGRLHDYAACDATRAYNSTAYALPGHTAKVSEVTRQVVFLRPQIIVVFDRVDATDPTYVKHVQWQSLQIPVFHGSSWVVSGGSGNLIGQTLLPVGATQAVIQGFSIDGMTVAPTTMGAESTGYRLEITSPSAINREYFLHVLEATDTMLEGLPTTALVDHGDEVGVTLASPTGDTTYTVMFHRLGAPGGELTVQRSDGSTVYRGSLGAGGVFYPAVSDGGAPPPVDRGVTDGGMPGLSP